jgi:predicted alpha/beta hydrolase family esterase
MGNLNLPEYDAINETFACRDFNAQLIKYNSSELFVVSGDNDPYLPIEKAKSLASFLSVPLILVPGGGHLNEESGFTTFPLLLEKMLPFLKNKLTADLD